MQVLEKILQEIEADYDVPFFATEAEGRAFMQGKAAQAREDRRIIRSHMEDASDTNVGKSESVSNPDKLDDGWIPVEEKLPDEAENPITRDFYEYEVTFKSDNVLDIRHYKYGRGHWWHGGQIVDEYVTAWRPKPEPYHPGYDR